MSKYHVGIKFDKWAPSVEGALFRDLTALQEHTDLIAICDSSDADRLLTFLNIQRLSLESLATFWLLYQVESEVNAPSHAERVITRNFIVSKNKMSLDPSPRQPMTLHNQDATITYNPFSQPPPANSAGIPADPRVALLFT